MPDLAIIGSGIAGISAAIYAKRSGICDFFILEKSLPGGQINYIDRIDNYPGLPLGIKGADFVKSLVSQSKELGIDIKQQEAVKIENPEKGLFSVKTADNKEHIAKSLIIATGASPRSLGLKGEDRFKGKGVSYCAVCDGFFFKDKVVAVVGGGNTALEEALYLSRIAKKVYVIHRRDKFRAFNYLGEEVLRQDNIEVVWDSIVNSLEGQDILEAVTLHRLKDNTDRELRLDGLFIAIGYTPNTRIIKGLADLDQDGFVKVTGNMATSCRGVFACGDCIQKNLKQLISAACEGAISAVSCNSYLLNER